LQSLSNAVFGLALIVMAAVSVYFAGRINAPRLPMQWGIGREPTWFAPRLIAIWFSFGLAVLVRLLILFMEAYSPEKLHGVLVGLIAFSAIITVVHIAHMTAAERWAARQ
jgi:hypothetical protein